MIYEMLRKDILCFVALVSVFLMAFSQAFFVLLEDTGFAAFMTRLKVCPFLY